MSGRSLRERFARFISPEPMSGCWLWTGVISDNGYGKINVGTKRDASGTVVGVRDYAHRVSFELNCGPIPAGLHIDHLCCNTACVNPRHLEPVTHAENLRRFGQRRTTCRAGHSVAEVGFTSNGRRMTCAECKRISRRASYHRRRASG